MKIASEMFELDEKGICHKLKQEIAKQTHEIIVPIQISNQDIEDIIVTAIEGGIGYWACLDNTNDYWKSQPKDMPVSQWATELILSSRSVMFIDTEDESERWELTLSKLLNGIKLNHINRPHDSDLENMDSTTADCIFQYALFKDVIYG